MQTEYKRSLGASWHVINAQEVSLGGLGIASLTMNSGNKNNLAPLRIIAAAPELLAQLEKAVDIIQGEWPQEQWPEQGVPAMLAAIKKAKGE